MNKRRIGKDFAVVWEIFLKTADGRKPYVLDAENIILRLVAPDKKSDVHEFTVEENVVTWIYRGRDQKILGVYSLELVQREGANGMITIDTCKAFELVAHTCEETDNETGDIVIDSLEFDSEVMLAPLGYGVDKEMSDDSENPVQNKVIKAYVDDAVSGKQDTISDLDAIRSGAEKGSTALQSIPAVYVTEDKLADKGYATKSELNGKQDTIADLENIRQGAAAGATALQSIPEQYATKAFVQEQIQQTIILTINAAY